MEITITSKEFEAGALPGPDFARMRSTKTRDFYRRWWRFVKNRPPWILPDTWECLIRHGRGESIIDLAAEFQTHRIYLGSKLRRTAEALADRVEFGLWTVVLPEREFRLLSGVARRNGYNPLKLYEELRDGKEIGVSGLGPDRSRRIYEALRAAMGEEVRNRNGKVLSSRP